jgi:hypothetical protein
MERFTGAWRRVLLHEPRGIVAESSKRVVWLQSAGGAFVDVRVPREHVGSCAAERDVKSFAGTAAWDGEAQCLTWARAVDYRGPSGSPDVGSIEWKGEDELLEVGVGEGEDYDEVWVRAAHPHTPRVVPDFAVRLHRRGGAATGVLLCAVNTWGLALGREGGEDEDARLRQHFAGDGEADEALTLHLQSYVGAVGSISVSAGEVGAAPRLLVEHCTRPQLEGTTAELATLLHGWEVAEGEEVPAWVGLAMGAR